VEDHQFRFDLGRRLSFFLINKLSKRILLNSHTLHRKFQPIFSKQKIKVIYYGIDVEKNPSSSVMRTSDSFRLMLAGRITESKGQADALCAVSILKKRGLPVQLVLLGTANPLYAAYLKQLQKELDISDCLNWVPFTDSPFEQMLTCDVALLCSRQEAFARVVIEAMKLGLPVIGSDSGGTPEQIRPGFNGLLYRTGDAIDLADKIEQLYRNRSLRKEMGKNAQQWADSIFRTERFRTDLGAILRQMLPVAERPEQRQQIMVTPIGE
jgi:glycosyltransferase involved in cell wall biosynthesis